jgi:hypothetical protein
MLYLSDYKKFPKLNVTGQTAGVTTIDSLATGTYRTVKYDLTVEDTYTQSIYQCRFTATHDSLHTLISEFDIISGDLDIPVDVVYTTVVGGYPTMFDIKLTFPVGFSGSWSLDKEVYINISNIQRDGFDGAGSGLFPSDYLYPNFEV